MLEGYAYGRPHGPQKTPVFETKWCIDADSIAKLPTVIVDGRWSDPAETFKAGRGFRPTQPVGPWGVYDENFTDAYSLNQIKPLQTQYKHIYTSMQSARDTLWIDERFVNEHGLIDNLPAVMQELQSWIDECNTKIQTALSKLPPSTTTPHNHTHTQGNTSLTVNLKQLSLLNES